MNDMHHLIDTELEAAVIGAILADGEPAYRAVQSLLSVDDFAVERHRIVYRSIVRVGEEVEPNVNAVANDLIETEKLAAVEGLAGLMDLHGKAMPLVGLEALAKTLRTKSKSRRALTLANNLTKSLELCGLNGNVGDIAATAQELIELSQAVNLHSGGIASIDALPSVCAAQEAIQFVREPELPEGCVIALTGDSGSGKSTLATAWVRDAISGGRPCLILDRESPRSVAVERMERLGLSDGPLLRWWGGWLGEVPGPASAVVLRWVESCNPKPLIVIDSLIAFLEGDENDATQMRRFMHTLRQLADRGATVIVIHHDGKSETSRDYRGSSDIKASVDQAFHVSNLGEDGKLDRITLRCFKSRIGFSGLISYRYAGGKFLRDERQDAPARTVADQLSDLLRQNPGIRTKEFEDAAVRKGVGRNKARDFLADSVLSGAIRREVAGRNQFRHYLPETQKNDGNHAWN